MLTVFVGDELVPLEGGWDRLVVGDCDVLLEVGPLEGNCDGLLVGSVVVVLKGSLEGSCDGLLVGPVIVVLNVGAVVGAFVCVVSSEVGSSESDGCDDGWLLRILMNG